MAEQLQLSLFGFAGLIGIVVVDRTSTTQDIKDAMIHQCRLPGWQYRFFDGEHELTSLESLAVSQPTPDTSLPRATVPRILGCLDLEVFGFDAGFRGCGLIVGVRGKVWVLYV